MRLRKRRRARRSRWTIGPSGTRPASRILRAFCAILQVRFVCSCFPHDSLHTVPLTLFCPGGQSAVKSQETSVPAILHFSAQQMYTKYDMAQILARVHQPPLEVGENLVRVDEGPKPGETVRPRDCHLSNVRSHKLRHLSTQQM